MKARYVALAALAAVGAIGAFLVQAQVLTPDQLKFQRNPATGSEIAVVMGDPSKAAPFVLRVKYPPGFKAMPHSHPIDIQVTVLSGTMLWTEGETFDESKLKEYPAGSFIFEKANVPHYQVAKTAVVFQAAATTGPNAFNFVNPKDDPRSQKK
jgi:quercetin dioxygenase-like cupin family protein